MNITYELELPIPVQVPGSTIKYQFFTVGGDISFGIFVRDNANNQLLLNGDSNNSSEEVPNKKDNENDNDGENNNNEEIEFLKHERLPSHLETISGEFTLNSSVSSNCILIFSWMNH